MQTYCCDNVLEDTLTYNTAMTATLYQYHSETIDAVFVTELLYVLSVQGIAC
jgi:hypothetical protein